MPRLGAVQTVILPALGQIIMGTLIDTFGWFESAQKAMSPLRMFPIKEAKPAVDKIIQVVMR